MTAPLSGLRRRLQITPLLVPLLALAVAGAAVFGLGLWARTTSVILVPHAETVATDAADADLSPAGEARARRLGPFLAETLPVGTVDHLYAADTRRAQQTAVSVANQFRLPINLVGSSDWSGLAGRIRREHRGATVVVVGQPAALQAIAGQLGVPIAAVPAGDVDTVLVVVVPSPGQPRLVRLRYGEPGDAPAAGKKAVPGRRD